MGWNKTDEIYSILDDCKCTIYVDEFGPTSIECESIMFEKLKELEIYLEKNTELEIDNISTKNNKIIIDLF